jgi:hypothetical protein
VISNGGDTMLQALACRRACVAVPIARDQAYRIKRCVRAGLVASARLDAADLERVALGMLEPDGARAPQDAHAAGLGSTAVANGIDAALAAIESLARLDEPEARRSPRLRPVPSAPGGPAARVDARAISAPRFLFLPVSGPHGMGEYARALQIAQSVAVRWPTAQIHFALSREAPYETDPAFAYTMLPSSPTFHTPEVIALIERIRPDVVVFDNAGRTAQLRAARRIGARVIYVSARARQRRKAFRLRWMSLIDEHWFAYPELLAGPLNAVETLKLRWMGRPLLRYLDVMLPPPDPQAAAAIRNPMCSSFPAAEPDIPARAMRCKCSQPPPRRWRRAALRRCSLPRRTARPSPCQPPCTLCRDCRSLNSPRSCAAHDS